MTKMQNIDSEIVKSPKASAFTLIVAFVCVALVGLALIPLLPVKLNPSRTLPGFTVRFSMPGTSARHDKIYFHGAKSGQKVDALKQNDKVCFTVYGNEHFEPGDWAPYVQSTVVFGRCHLIDDAAATEARVRELGMKYYPGKEEVEKEIALYIKAVQLYEITIEQR